MKRIRIGHVGTLHDHSSAKLACVKKFPQLFEIVGCVVEDTEQEKKIKGIDPYIGIPFMSRDEMLNKGIDAVLIEGFELDLIKEALFWIEHDVHVHIDKPAGGDVKTFEKLLHKAKDRNLVVQMAYMYRYNKAFLDCLKRIEAGELGNIYEVDAIMNTNHSVEKRIWLENFNGGIQFYLGCHMIDLVYRLQGLPEKIHPFLKSTGFDGVRSIDHSMAVFEYSNGISTVRATSTEINGYGRRQLVVCGSKGTYEIEPLESPTRAFFISESASNTYADCRKEIPLPPFDGFCRYDDMMKDFARFVRGEKQNPYSFEYELELQKLLMFCCGNKDVRWENITEI